VKTYYDNPDRKRLSLDQSTKLITSLLEKYESATIVIDSLDECIAPRSRYSPSESPIASLLDSLKYIRENSPCVVKFLVSSRKNDVMGGLLTKRISPVLSIPVDENNSDIERVVKVLVKKSIDNQNLFGFMTDYSELEKYVIDTLNATARGM
jgi:hypothetical protein